MGKMTEERFRKAVATYLGFKKGNISKALEEAIDLWLNSQKRSIRPTRLFCNFYISWINQILGGDKQCSATLFLRLEKNMNNPFQPVWQDCAIS